MEIITPQKQLRFEESDHGFTALKYQDKELGSFKQMNNTFLAIKVGKVGKTFRSFNDKDHAIEWLSNGQR